MSRKVGSFVCQRCHTRLLAKDTTPKTSTKSRLFSISSSSRADSGLEVFGEALGERTTRTKPSSTSPPRTPPAQMSQLDMLAREARAEASTRPGSGVSENEPYHVNVYAHKHNLHITFTEPSRNPIISYSAGNIGLRKAQRATFDAAYQLSTYTMRKMAEKSWRIGGKGMTMNKMLTLNEQEVRDRGIELIFRGHGPGREAFQKALLSNEGKILKPLIKRVVDGTRLKFGGTRSPAQRRLG